MNEFNPVTPDDYKLQRTVALDAKALEAEKRRLYIEDMMYNSPVTSGDGVNFGKEDQQLGRPLSPHQLESKLSKICHNLHFITHPNNPTKKVVYHLKPDGKKEFICAYENRYMPEHSVMRVIVHEYPDPDFIATGKAIERSELPAYEKVEDVTSPFGYGYEFDPKARRPGMLYIEKGHGEETRGWRTVLLRLIQHNLITVDAAEREFSTDNRAEWAKSTGKRKDAPTVW